MIDDVFVPHIIMISSYGCSLKCNQFQEEKKTVNWLHHICLKQNVYGYYEHYLLMSIIFVLIGIFA